jgi:hypothetical protein
MMAMVVNRSDGSSCKEVVEEKIVHDLRPSLFNSSAVRVSM